MNQWKVKNTDTGKVWHKDSRQDAEKAVEEFSHMDLEIIPPDDPSNEAGKEPAQADGGTTKVVEATPTEEDLPDDPAVDQDPVNYLPEHFIDTIQGVPTVNRKGYAVIASKYGVSVTAEPVTLPSETEFEYAEFQATAVTKGGEEYSGFGSAHIDRQDGDDPHLLAELAETRAMKRAVSWATGVGMTAAEELMHEL